MNDTATDSFSAAITLVVPIYRDYNATRNCLESLAGSAIPDHVTVVLIDDFSPEPELVEYCELIAAREGFTLLRNEENLGFVKTANRGFTVDQNADVLLLNSDTVVSWDWITRIEACAYREKSIGTVTPFSNNGTICSYPVFPISNDLPQGWTSSQLDTVFSLANAGAHHEIPTAVGFCMYIKRACLTATGIFDEAKFGTGYGEENDYSLRATALGWKHVIAADVFVYHAGGASFASESDERKRQADAIIDQLHPQYDALITNFINSDPLHTLRANADTQRIKDRPAGLPQVLQEHSRYQETLLQRIKKERDAVIHEKKQRQSIELMLTQCREQFGQTDKALKAADEVVSQLNTNFEALQVEAKRLLEETNSLSSELYITKDQRNELRGLVETMERSRSWRYTRLLRRNQ